MKLRGWSHGCLCRFCIKRYIIRDAEFTFDEIIGEGLKVGGRANDSYLGKEVRYIATT